MLALDPRGLWDFTPESDRESDSPATFVLRVMTKRERDFVMSQQEKLSLIKWSYLAFKLVVGGWSGIQYRSEDGELVELEYSTEPGKYSCTDRTDFVREDLIGLLPMEVWSECILAAIQGNSLSEDDKKK
jgi:hypothetical protein